ncbi:MAG TPA: hypothetical protein VN903_12000 [Polyangia bacterium]|nr:hypothetical protein [Polyangia bacterium]
MAALFVGVTGGVVSAWRKSRASSCVDIAGAACSSCRKESKAKFCEASYIAPQASGDIKVNGQTGCCGFEDPKLRANCEAILRCVRTTGCAVGNDPSPCFCGTIPAPVCGKGIKPPNGPCLAAYNAGLEGGPPGTALKLFGSPTSPLGVANNTFTCDVDSSCPCGQTKPGQPQPQK